MHQGRHQDDAYRRIEVITGRVQRRRWTPDEKAQILTESLVPGAQVSDVARRHNLNRNLLQTWRRQAMRASDQAGTTFVPIHCADDAPAPQTAASVTVAAVPGKIDVEIGRARIRVQGAVDLDVLRQVLSVIGQNR